MTISTTRIEHLAGRVTNKPAGSGTLAQWPPPGGTGHAQPSRAPRGRGLEQPVVGVGQVAIAAGFRYAVAETFQCLGEQCAEPRVSRPVSDRRPVATSVSTISETRAGYSSASAGPRTHPYEPPNTSQRPPLPITTLAGKHVRHASQDPCGGAIGVEEEVTIVDRTRSMRRSRWCTTFPQVVGIDSATMTASDHTWRRFAAPRI
jgi:hypothetical protein